MTFNGTEGAAISLSVASAMTARYRQNNPNQIKAHFFGKEILAEILSQHNCVGIRMYYGINENGDRELVLVGVDQGQNDILDLVVDLSAPCPKACSTANPLNS